MTCDQDSLESWLEERPAWMREAVRRILQNGRIGKNDLGQLVAICKSEAGIDSAGQPPSNLNSPIRLPDQQAPTQHSIRLLSIFDPKGINALAPRKPLMFVDGPLTAVYGLNASGKSGYIRALKHASGQRKPGLLYADVFSIGIFEQSCRIKYQIDGVTKEVTWTLSRGPVNDLRDVQVFDSTSGSLYINEENEAAYEPPILSLFTQLTEVCGLVNAALAAEIVARPPRKPIMPAALQGTDSETWYRKLSYLTTKEDVDRRCEWMEESEVELQGLTQRLAEANPTFKAKEIRRQRDRILELKHDLTGFGQNLSDTACAAYLATVRDSKTKRSAADAAASVVFSNAPLDGVGTDVWKLLWTAARAYSEGSAYRNLPFPNVAIDALCVLCQQGLSTDAKQRLLSFESFVKGDLETQAVSSSTRVAKLYAQLPTVDEPQLGLRMDSAGLAVETVREAIKYYSRCFEARRLALQTAEDISQLPPIPSEELLGCLTDTAAELESKAASLDQDAGGQHRPAMENRRNELLARKWLSQQKTSVQNEIERLQFIHRLEAAQRLTNTQQLSTKKSALADELITGAFIQRFQGELEILGASRIKVQLVKTRTERGHVFHEIRLQDPMREVPAANVLSEGEFRIVSLAAFLADSEVRGQGCPFIFDDPISSLDQVFEQATAERLVGLSRSRQVIIFTHRLSFLEHLERAAEPASCKVPVVYVRREIWGAGEPGAPRLAEMRPEAALEELSQRIKQARSVMEQHGQARYEELVRGICGDFRITIERVIERVLLCDIVRRHSRELHTKGKIKELSKIKAEDCALFDGLMSNYSTYEHSQSDEAPAEIPQPDDILADVNTVREWIGAFKKRT